MPAITGPVVLGQTLTADTGTWSGTTPVDFTYQWQRCDAAGANCVDIPGADDDTYTLTTDDQGHTVVVVVTATNDAGVDTATSAPSAVLPAPPVNTTAPSVDGVTEIGEELTADPGDVVRHRPVHLRVPVAALRLLRQQLRRHRRGDR